MGTSRSVAEFAAKMDRLGMELGVKAPPETVKLSALAVKQVMQAGAAGAGLRDGALVGRDRKRQAKFGVGFNLTAGGLQALVRYRVPRIAAIFDRGAPSHVISRKGDPFGRLKIGDGAAMGPFNHPGMAARNYWPSTKRKAQEAAAKASRTPFVAAIRRVIN